jgi:quercetin dioxygenase-like cupin family protein
MSPSQITEVERNLSVESAKFVQAMQEISIPMPPRGTIKLVPDEWRDIEKKNVDMRICSLTSKTSEVTVANVFFRTGGTLLEHTHDRQESIFVVDGAYIDPVSQKVYQAGDVQIIPPFTLHAAISDYCLLTVVWKPAYTELKEERRSC